MEKYAVIVAGGSGTRMGTSTPKQFLLLRSKPLIWYSLTAFFNSFKEINIILVLPPAFMEAGSNILASFNLPKKVNIVEGGATRFHSVFNALAFVPGDCVVFVHDGVRAMVTPALLQFCYSATLSHGNAIPAISATDTIRIISESGSKVVDRNKVKLVQTPQTFMSNQLKNAYQQEYQDSFTDDASVVERMGEKVHLVEGEVTNIKITFEIDMIIAEQILLKRGL